MASIIVDNVRLRDDIEQNADFTVQFNTNIVATVGGRETASIRWVYPRHQYDISYGVQNSDDLYEIQEFYFARRGRARGFRFKDWNDFQLNNLIGEGDALETEFQIVKLYDDIIAPFSRKITHPVSGSVSVTLDGTPVSPSDYDVDYETGIIDFDSAPGSGVDIGVVCEFDVPVRFSDDTNVASVIWIDAKSIPSINLIEVRV